jgi:biopolymer transport protein ExbB/TolQ
MEKESISDALEAKYVEIGPHVTSLIVFISLAANISTLLGLLGTIDGLIDSFASLATVDPSLKSKVLSQGISKAMNTTLLGLISAISIMVLNTIVSARANKVLGTVDEYSYKLLDLLACKKKVEE